MAFEELKERQSVMWGNGPYERVTDTLADAHDTVVGRVAAQPGERWLDLATGTGAVARNAARAGAVVTGIDLSPALIETAKREAEEEGLDIDFRVGDCENLADVETGSFDIVTSTFGVMFAPEPGGDGRRARASRPPRRTAGDGQLDSRRRGRRAVPDHEAVPAAAARGR